MTGEQIQARLEKSGRTISQLAKAAGLSASTVSRYVRGETDARGTTLEKIRGGLIRIEREQLSYLLDLHGLPETWERKEAAE